MKLHSQHENLALEERLDKIRLLLYKELGGTVWYNYMWESPVTGETLIEPQHNFGIILPDQTFVGGGIYDKDIFNDKVVNVLLEDLRQWRLGVNDRNALRSDRDGKPNVYIGGSVT